MTHAERDHGHDSTPAHRSPQDYDSAEAFWEALYAERGQRWSGRPNQRLVEVAADLPGGRALDLGCGEGGDAVWLARNGWEVTAVDISPTALGRLGEAAAAEGVADRIHAVQAELGDEPPRPPEGGWDLVSAQFFQSPLALPRTAILRAAAADIAPGGLLLVVDHGAGPPGSSHEHAEFPTVEETVAELALPEEAWSPVRVERATREATGPEGATVELVDNVIALCRR